MLDFVIKHAGNCYYFALVTPKGRVILTGHFFANVADCRDGIFSVVNESRCENAYSYHISPGGSFYFLVRSGDGDILAISRYFRDKKVMKSAIAALKRRSASIKTGVDLGGGYCFYDKHLQKKLV